MLLHFGAKALLQPHSGLSVPSQKTRFPVDWRLLVEERIANIGIPLDILGFCCFKDFLRLEIFWVFGFLRTSVLCIIGELAGGGSVDVGLCIFSSAAL